MKKKVDYTEQFEMSEEEKDMSGDCVGFFRVVAFEGATKVEAKGKPSVILLHLALAMSKDRGVWNILKKAGKIAKEIKKDPDLSISVQVLLARLCSGDDNIDDNLRQAMEDIITPN